MTLACYGALEIVGFIIIINIKGLLYGKNCIILSSTLLTIILAWVIMTEKYI